MSRRPLLLQHVAQRRVPDELCRRARGHDAYCVHGDTGGGQAEARGRLEGVVWVACALWRVAVCGDGSYRELIFAPFAPIVLIWWIFHLEVGGDWKEGNGFRAVYAC